MANVSLVAIALVVGHRSSCWQKSPPQLSPVIGIVDTKYIKIYSEYTVFCADAEHVFLDAFLQNGALT
jgi:hypothetical protein